MKKEDIRELYSRKEVYQYKAGELGFRKPTGSGLTDHIPHVDEYTSPGITLQSHQLLTKTLIGPDSPIRRLHCNHACHPAGTQVILPGGLRKRVELLRVGEWVCGIDKHVRITELHTGTEELYELASRWGKIKCNLSHIHVFIVCASCPAAIAAAAAANMVVDTPIARMYVRLSEYIGRESDFMCGCSGCAAPVAQLCGVKASSWSTAQARCYDEFVSHRGEAKCMCGGVDPLGIVVPVSGGYTTTEIITMSNMCFIVRAMYVGRILDTIAYTAKHKIITRVMNRDVARELCFLVRSLGALCRVSRRGAGVRLTLTGDLDFLVWSKFANMPVRRADLRFTVKPLGTGKYYGFTLDGDPVYLLSNFMVTHNTGLGKTLVALEASTGYTEAYKHIYAKYATQLGSARRNFPELSKLTPYVYVLGFTGTKTAFVNELISNPMFGFISYAERAELTRLRRQADIGTTDDKEAYKLKFSRIKRRLGDKSSGGFYRFLGYDEFVNFLFPHSTKALKDIEARIAANSDLDLVAEIDSDIAAGKISLDKKFLASFARSFVICDEIHNVYNMNAKNNRGIALVYVLAKVPTVALLTLSATPINNSPSEVVELLEILTGRRINKRELFTGRDLRPGALEAIADASRGHISFLQDANIQYYPEKREIGNELAIGDQVIPYLRFIPCPMSPIHQATYERSRVERADSTANAVDTGDTGDADADADEDVLPGGLSSDGYALYDGVFPNPDDPTIGLFRSVETREKIISADVAWQEQAGINVRRVGQAYIFSGSFMELDNLRKWSSKHARLIEEIIAVLRSGERAKMMVYHDRVKMTGVLFIQEALKHNGIIGEFDVPIGSTLCCVCGKRADDHVALATVSATVSTEPAEPTHDFTAARFVIAHSEIDKSVMESSLAKFNSPQNLRGDQFCILVGSKIIKESYNFKAVKYLFVTALPTNISTLLQVFGRIIRKFAHADLPTDERIAVIKILVSVAAGTFVTPAPGANSGTYPRVCVADSPEPRRYYEKLLDYKVIQQIEMVMNRGAVDGGIHRDIVMGSELLRLYWPGDKSVPAREILGNLYFEPDYDYELEELSTTTFTAYGHYHLEISNIVKIIKRLFLYQPVWTKAALVEAVRAPPFSVESNPALIDLGNIEIALASLVKDFVQVVDEDLGTVDADTAAIMMTDPEDKYVYLHNGSVSQMKIVQVGDNFLLAPIATTETFLGSKSTTRAESRDQVRSVMAIEPRSNRPYADVETYLRRKQVSSVQRVNVRSYVLSSSRVDSDLLKKMMSRVAKITETEDISWALFEYPVHTQLAAVEQSILYFLSGGDVSRGEQYVNTNNDHASNKSTGDRHPADKMFSEVIEFYSIFGAVIYAGEVQKYKSVMQQFKASEAIFGLDADVPIGYTSSRACKIHDVTTGEWFEVSRLALNRYSTWRENDTVVGYLESATDGCKFKLRKPTQVIKEVVAKEVHARRMSKSSVVADSSSGVRGKTTRQSASDSRLAERGIVCSTKSKSSLAEILSALGIKAEPRIGAMCEAIKRKLLTLEAVERDRDSRVKYFYGWWDEMPNTKN